MIIKIIDTETTGLDPAIDQMVELGIVTFDTTHMQIVNVQGWLFDLFDEGLLRPRLAKVEHIHGISWLLLDEHGEVRRDAVTLPCDAERFGLAGDSILLAHNAAFDRQWFDDSVKGSDRWVCSMSDIEWPRMNKAKKSLVDLALSHGVAVMAAHRAVEDCLTLARILATYEKEQLEALFLEGLKPKATYIAQVSFDQKQLAKDHGFHWVQQDKQWRRKMSPEVAAALPFKTTILAERKK